MAKKSKKAQIQVAETPEIAEPRVVKAPKIAEPQVVETPKIAKAVKRFEFKSSFIRR